MSSLMALLCFVLFAMRVAADDSDSSSSEYSEHPPSQEEECDKACTLIYQPVCGSDGTTYGNRCMLEIKQCETDGRVVLAYPGECAEGCDPYVENRVCGSDGISYASYCALWKEKKKNPNLFFVHSGECQKEGTCSRRCNSFETEIQCGGDGVNYDSLCHLQQAGCKSGKLNPFLHMGECHRCSEFCTLHLDWTCGSDGVSYQNLCHLNAEACRTHTQIMPMHKGVCISGEHALVRQRCAEFYKDEVCANDGRTFFNICTLEEMGGVEAYRGSCPREGSCQKICLKRSEGNLICGSDGETYRSQCELVLKACEQRRRIVVSHKGACGECRAGCPEIYAPLCGSDGETHENSCMLNRANCLRGKKHPGMWPIYILHRGECHRGCPDVCPCNYKPVCGTDGQTYSNSCLLSVASCKSPTMIDLAYNGACSDKCHKACTKIYKPVCGSDGTTYGNKCMLEIKQCETDGRVVLAHAGECAKDCAKTCLAIFDPVCGSDGITYSNACQLGVETCKTNGTVVLARTGPC